jgi:hypothetical protein
MEDRSCILRGVCFDKQRCEQAMFFFFFFEICVKKYSVVLYELFKSQTSKEKDEILRYENLVDCF